MVSEVELPASYNESYRSRPEYGALFMCPGGLLLLHPRMSGGHSPYYIILLSIGRVSQLMISSQILCFSFFKYILLDVGGKRKAMITKYRRSAPAQGICK